MQASRPISFAYPDLEPEPEPEAFFSVAIPPTPSPRPSRRPEQPLSMAPSAAGMRPLPSMASPAAVGMRPQPPLPSSALGSFGGGFGAEPEPEPEPDAGDLASRLASMSPASRRLEEMEAQHPALELERVSTRLEELRQEGRDVQKHVDHLRREIEAATAELEKQRGAKQEMARKLELAEDESQAEYLHNASIFEENAKMQQELHELQEKTAAARAEEEEDLAKTAELEARLAVEEGETEALLKQVKELEASALEAERLVEQRTREKEAEKEAEKKLMAELEQCAPPPLPRRTSMKTPSSHSRDRARTCKQAQAGRGHAGGGPGPAAAGPGSGGAERHADGGAVGLAGEGRAAAGDAEQRGGDERGGAAAARHQRRAREGARPPPAAERAPAAGVPRIVARRGPASLRGAAASGRL